ncbi:9620_t:CDS:2, partial [Gigaspora margarita]
MPFGIFTTVNNYGQSICFAGTLILNKNTNSFNWVFSMFLKLVNNYAPKVFFTDEDSAIIKSVKQIFQPFGTKHVLCLWHLFKNVIKNLNGVLESDWAMFIKSFYKCLNEYEESNFVEKWEQLKTHYPKAVKYLSKMDKNLKRYMDAITSLTTFLKAFESAIEQRKEAAEFIKYQENNETIKLKINSYYRDFALKICNEIGSRKASTPMVLMAHFEVLRPGYYGSRGLNIISDALFKLFLDTNLLTYDLVALKKPVDYLQEVLVPKTALCLISQDRGSLELELVQEIMEDSANF